MKTYLSFLGLAPGRIGGTEVFARELSVQLAEAGWQSVLCFLREPEGTVRDYLALPNVVLETMRGAADPAMSDLPRGVELFRRYRPEILHLQYAGLNGPWPRIARAMGIRKIYLTDHSSRPEGYIPKSWSAWKRILTRQLAAPLSGILTVSDYGDVCTRALSLISPERVRRIYNGIDVTASGDGAAFRREYGIGPDAPLIIQVSNMIPEKGIDDFLEAAKIVLAARPSARFALIGGGRRREEFMQRAQAIGVSPQVLFTGLMTDPVRGGAYAAADIVCQVSRWEEVFGFVIAEAMAASKPVIGTNVGGIPERIRDGANGYLVPRRDPGAIADRILRLIADPALRVRMGADGRRSAETNFDVRDRIRELLQFAGVTTV